MCQIFSAPAALSCRVQVFTDFSIETENDTAIQTSLKFFAQHSWQEAVTFVEKASILQA